MDGTHLSKANGSMYTPRAEAWESFFTEVHVWQLMIRVLMTLAHLKYARLYHNGAKNGAMWRLVCLESTAILVI